MTTVLQLWIALFDTLVVLMMGFNLVTITDTRSETTALMSILLQFAGFGWVVLTACLLPSEFRLALWSLSGLLFFADAVLGFRIMQQ